jgi:hypothetical protein
MGTEMGAGAGAGAGAYVTHAGTELKLGPRVSHRT